MKSHKECPLCGKIIDDENNELCGNCKSYADNQYRTDLLYETAFHEVNNSQEMEESVNKNSQINDNYGNAHKSDRVKRKISTTLFLYLVGCIVVVILGIWGVYNTVEARKFGETEQLYWDICTEENTPTSYSKYLVRFPEGKYQTLAHQRIDSFRANENKEWMKINKSSNLNDYFTFILKYPKSLYIDTIKNKIDSLAWQQTVAIGNSDAYQEYLEKVYTGVYKGAYSEDAEYRYEYLTHLDKLDTSTSDSILTLLNNFYQTVATLNKKEITKYLESAIIYYGDTINSMTFVDAVKDSYKEKKIDEIEYHLSHPFINAYKDNQGMIFIDLVVSRITKRNETPTHQKKNVKSKPTNMVFEETLRIKLNQFNKIVLIDYPDNFNFF